MKLMTEDEDHKIQKMIRIIHAKINRENTEEISFQSHWGSELFSGYDNQIYSLEIYKIIEKLTKGLLKKLKLNNMNLLLNSTIIKKTSQTK